MGGIAQISYITYICEVLYKYKSSKSGATCTHASSLGTRSEITRTLYILNP